MSILKLEIKETHIKLLKHLKTNINGNNLILSIENLDDELPITDYDKYSYIDLILNGNETDDPLNTEDIKEYSEEQKAEWDKLYSELPTVLDIVLYNGNFEIGSYKTKWHLRDWKKIN